MNLQIYLILLFIILLSNCVLKPPAITFTQTQTAAERQMIGEEKELEKDGWLIASIKTSSSGSDEWRKDAIDTPDSPEDRDYIALLRTISYLAPEIKKYKDLKILGEGLNGYLIKLPPAYISKAGLKVIGSEEKIRLEEVYKITNETRDLLFEIKYKKESSTLGEDVAKQRDLAKNIRLTYYKSALKGEFIEVTKGKWAAKE